MNTPTSEVAYSLEGCRFVSAELMYRPRPTELRARTVFDFALNSRLAELSRYDDAAVLLICNSQTTVESFADLPGMYPRLKFVSAITNPEPLALSPRDTEMPVRGDWPDPANWRPYMLTDRWARITFALDVAHQLHDPGTLVMPANDAVWGRGLLALLTRLSNRHAKNGLPAAISPYTYHQHSAVSEVDIPQDIIDALNAAFAHDSWLRWRLRSGSYQAFWGKMGLLPFGICGEILHRAETFVWEDDLEIDRVIREDGYGLHCHYVANPALYRQALPVFDRVGLRAVIERTLHYSLNIPGETSLLQRPLDRVGQWHRRLSPRFARAFQLSEAITAECSAEIEVRLKRYGMSWVDWGAYRYGVRVGDPRVQVWKYGGGMVQL